MRACWTAWDWGPGPVVKFDDEARIGALRQLNERPFDSDPPTTADWQAAVVDAFPYEGRPRRPRAEGPVPTGGAAARGLPRGPGPTCEVFACDELAPPLRLVRPAGRPTRHRLAQPALRARFRWAAAADGFDANAGEPSPPSVRCAKWDRWTSAHALGLLRPALRRQHLLPELRGLAGHVEHPRPAGGLYWETVGRTRRWPGCDRSSQLAA